MGGFNNGLKIEQHRRHSRSVLSGNPEGLKPRLDARLRTSGMTDSIMTRLSDSFKSIIVRSGAMWQSPSSKGVIPASEARRESFLKQRKIPDKPE
jgi:hypothetical protein